MQSYLNVEYDRMCYVIRFLGKYESEFEPEGSEGSEDFIVVPGSFSFFVIYL